MKVTYLILFSMLLVACATTGKDTALVVKDTEWKYKKSFGSESFTYQCGNGVSIETPKILVARETHWVGPIIPIFPVFSKKDFGEASLSLKLKIIGTARLELEALEFSALTDQGSFNGKPVVHAQENWAVLNVEFPTTIRDLHKFTITFSQPILGCEVSEIQYTRQESSSGEFILSLGP